MTLREFVECHCGEGVDIRLNIGCEGFVEWDRRAMENEFGRDVAEYIVTDWVINRDCVIVYTA